MRKTVLASLGVYAVNTVPCAVVVLMAMRAQVRNTAQLAFVLQALLFLIVTVGWFAGAFVANIFVKESWLGWYASALSIQTIIGIVNVLKPGSPITGPVKEILGAEWLVILFVIMGILLPAFSCGFGAWLGARVSQGGDSRGDSGVKGSTGIRAAE